MEQINRLKVVLVEQRRTGKWLAETLGKNEATMWIYTRERTLLSFGTEARSVGTCSDKRVMSNTEPYGFYVSL